MLAQDQSYPMESEDMRTTTAIATVFVTVGAMSMLGQTASAAADPDDSPPAPPVLSGTFHTVGLPKHNVPSGAAASWTLTPCGAGCVTVKTPTWTETAHWQAVPVLFQPAYWAYVFQRTDNSGFCYGNSNTDSNGNYEPGWNIDHIPITFTVHITPGDDPNNWNVNNDSDVHGCPYSTPQASYSLVRG